MNFFRAQIFTSITDLFTKGHERSISAKKNILASFFIRGAGIAISLALIPLTINYVNPSRYGIWLTLSSIVIWFSFFDIGLTQGLRNKFAEAKTKGDDYIAQIYVSTTYALLAIIFFIIWIVFIVVNQYLNWAKILNVPENIKSEVTLLAVIVFTYFCLNFVLRIISTIITANQQPAKALLIDFFGQLASLLIILVLVKTTEGSLIKLGVALCVAPLLVLVGANLFFFNGEFRKYRPKISMVKFSYAKGLFNLGVAFFIIQVAGIVQFQTANIIIAQYFNTAEVTSFNIVFRYFGVLLTVFTIFITPFWSASTEAFLKNDIQWIRNSIRRYNQLNIAMLLAGLLMLVFSGPIYRLWLGEGKVNIDFSLSLWGFLYFNVAIYGGKYVHFLNGINALRMQFWASLISPFLYVAIAIILIRYFHMNVYSLFVASIIANFNAYFLAPLQYFQIINRNKRGIWIK